MRIKKLLTAVLAAVFLFVPVTTTTDGAETAPDYSDDTNHRGFYGRLYVPSADIDVALYLSNKQSVVDRQDSAAMFRLSYRPKVWIIADHNTQSFASMTDIEVGDEATIVKHEGGEILLECTEVFDGHNTGHGLTDNHGVNIVGPYPYVTYTCIGYWRNIRICQWSVVNETFGEETAVNE